MLCHQSVYLKASSCCICLVNHCIIWKLIGVLDIMCNVNNLKMILANPIKDLPRSVRKSCHPAKMSYHTEASSLTTEWHFHTNRFSCANQPTNTWMKRGISLCSQNTTKCLRLFVSILAPSLMSVFLY